MPDGSAFVHDPSTQKSERYTPQSEDGLQAGVEKIVAVATEKEGLGIETASALRSRSFLSEERRQVNESRQSTPPSH